MLAGVLERLEAAEVHGRLDVAVVAADPLGDELDVERAAVARPRAAPRGARSRRAAAGRCRGRARGAPGWCPAPRRRARRASRRPPAGSSATHVLRETEVDGERDEVLLGAVVQVALDAAALGVAARHDACPRRAKLVGLAAQLVEGCLQRGVELGVVQREADLARELGEHAVVLFAERVRPLCALDDDEPEQLAGVADRRDAQRAARRGPSMSEGSHTDVQALPETPARGDDGALVGPRRRSSARRGRAPTRRARAPRPMPV